MHDTSSIMFLDSKFIGFVKTFVLEVNIFHGQMKIIFPVILPKYKRRKENTAKTTNSNGDAKQSKSAEQSISGVWISWLFSHTVLLTCQERSQWGQLCPQCELMLLRALSKGVTRSAFCFKSFTLAALRSVYWRRQWCGWEAVALFPERVWWWW